MKLTHPNSPLARQTASERIKHWPGDTRQLSPADQATLKRILAGKYEYVENELFHLDRPEAEKQIFEKAPEIKEPDTSWYHPVLDNTDSANSRINKRVGNVLLTSKQERAIFLQYNYCRYQVCLLRELLSRHDLIAYEPARELLDWHEKAEHYREKIAQTNLALVLAMAKRCRVGPESSTGLDFADLVSEGNMALLRAVDKFDVGRGYKFSTYACRAILKAFSRAGMKMSRYRQLFPTDFDPALEKSDHVETRRAEHRDDCVDEIRQIIRDNRAELSNVEREVIEHRFPFDPDPDATPQPRSRYQVATRNHTLKKADTGSGMTLEQVGRIIGVTKERVRQIQNKALDKIRVALESDFLA